MINFSESPKRRFPVEIEIQKSIPIGTRCSICEHGREGRTMEFLINEKSDIPTIGGLFCGELIIKIIQHENSFEIHTETKKLNLIIEEIPSQEVSKIYLKRGSHCSIKDQRTGNLIFFTLEQEISENCMLLGQYRIEKIIQINPENWIIKTEMGNFKLEFIKEPDPESVTKTIGGIITKIREYLGATTKMPDTPELKTVKRTPSIEERLSMLQGTRPSETIEQ
ncbi:MAG: hypothetical protein N4A36_04360 [Candidatus Gracilibacteria bacterium]|jgi:hypothetical protein|nr:hypothetical protein [Candidatus Gracilibacteria bacterium]